MRYLICAFTFSAIVFANSAFAQGPEDGIRFSYMTQNGGTARSQAIGGAGASLGGEFSSLFINPAGLGFYKTGDFVVTPNFMMNSNKGSYLGNGESTSKNSFNLGATGIVFSVPPTSKSISNISVGIGINRVADFNNYTYYKGKNNKTSYSEKYLEELFYDNVRNPNDAARNYPYGTSLAFNTYLINPIFDGGGNVTGYETAANPSTGLNQENTVKTKGGITDISLGMGVNVKDKWYFGGSISVPYLRYDKDLTYRESDASGNPNNGFDFFEVKESLQTSGMGLGAKFGAIFKPVSQFRLGLAVHTPTFYQLTDTYVTSVSTDLEGTGGSGIKYQSSTDLTGGDALISKYYLFTPWKFAFSATLLLNEHENVQQQKGFITADVEYINYKGITFKDAGNSTSGKDYYKSVNETMSQIYQNAFNVKVGGELKFSTVMVRAGAAYYGNPYKNENGNVFKLSGGLGYRNKGMFIDLTYVHSFVKDFNMPYRLQDKPNNPAIFKNNIGTIVATLGFKI